VPYGNQSRIFDDITTTGIKKFWGWRWWEFIISNNLKNWSELYHRLLVVTGKGRLIQVHRQ
jgi:hypothetical protein